MSKKIIERLRTEVNKAAEKYNKMRVIDVMANDLLYYAEDVMKKQKRLIIALQNELRNSSVIEFCGDLPLPPIEED